MTTPHTGTEPAIPAPRAAPPAPPRAAPPAPPRPRFEFRPRPSTAAARRPGAVTVACALWCAAAALGALGTLLVLLRADTVAAAVTAVFDHDYPAETAATRERVITLVSLVLVGGGALIATTQAGAALALRVGRGAARFWLVLLAVAAGAHTLLAAGVAGAATAAVLAAGVLLGLVATVVMLLPGTYRWFELKQR